MIDVQIGSKRVEGEKPRKVMNQIQKKVIRLQNKFETTFHQVLSELEKHEIFLINEMELNPLQAMYVKQYFKDKVQPVLSPIMLHNVYGFPYLKDKSIYLATKLTSSDKSVPVEYAIIEIPSDVLPRFIELPSESDRKFLILLEDVIRYSLDEVFAIFHFKT